MSGRDVLAVLTIAFVAMGCAARGGQGGSAPGCRPAEGNRTGAAVANGQLRGEFRLTLVNESGDSVSGRLSLRPQHDSLQYVPGVPGATIPLIGTAEIAVEDVGALRVGRLDSTDPNRPGVAVIRRGDEITIRMGSETNRRGEQAFDGATFALFVAAADDTGFRGRWSSSVELSRTTGYFCAYRAEAR